MTPVDQEFLADDGEIGDCVRACTASVLDLPREEVPHFVKDQPGHEWYDTWVDFVGKHGYHLTEILGPFDKPPRPVGYYLASGISARGFKHMVVMQSGKLAHDPHPSRVGLEKFEMIWLIRKR